VQREVLLDLAAETGFDRAAFAAAMDRAPVDTHIAASRQLMGQVGAGGFPTFLLEIDGHWQGVPHNRFASNANAFGEWLRERLVANTTA